jgi:hypothetical protein
MASQTEEFEKHVAGYEIFVVPGKKIKQLNPIPKFDLIYDSLSHPKVKNSRALSSMKGKINSSVKMIRLPSKQFVAELNSHLVEKTFQRNKHLDVSEAVLDDRNYG